VSRAGNHSVPSAGLLFEERNSRRPEKLSRRPSRLLEMRNREARRATKAALAGLRSGSIRSAGCRYGYDRTARIEHLSQPEPDARFLTPGFFSGVRSALSLRCGGFELPLERRETTTSPRLRLARCAVGYSSPRRPRRSRHPMNHPTMNTAPTKATTTPMLTNR
jgi:hypothetical protein